MQRTSVILLLCLKRVQPEVYCTGSAKEAQTVKSILKFQKQFQLQCAVSQTPSNFLRILIATVSFTESQRPGLKSLIVFATSIRQDASCIASFVDERSAKVD